MSRVAAVGTRSALALIAFGCALCLLTTFAAAQNQPKDEIFGGYAVLFPNGNADTYPGFPQNFKPHDIPNAFDASNTYYFCKFCNVGFLLDGSGHFHGTQFPLNPTGGRIGTGVGYALAGVEYKYHASPVSPFVRIFMGAANLSPDCCHGTDWSFAAGGGGGLDLTLNHRFSLRMVQFDYIYSNYPQRSDLKTAYPTDWNSIRLAAGIVVNLGSCSTPTPPMCTALATPSEVWAGDPVNLTPTCKGFNPKHPTNYSWTTPGGKLSSNNVPTPTVDTTGVVPGSYIATVVATDPKEKKNNTATATAPFVIKQPQAPIVSCSADPAALTIGQSSTVTMTATDPQGWPMTYGWSATGGQLSGSGTTATLTATKADAGNTITVTGTATDPRASMSASCAAQVAVPQIVKCVNIEDWGECTFEKDPKRPWRVDNDCRDTLDKLALRVQQMPNGKLDVVGYTDEKEVVKEQTLGAQRSVNVKYYLTTDGPTKIDASRVQPRAGSTKGKATHFYFVPEGTLCGGQLEEGTTVDESQVQPQSRTAPAHKKKAKKAAAPPAQ